MRKKYLNNFFIFHNICVKNFLKQIINYFFKNTCQHDSIKIKNLKAIVIYQLVMTRDVPVSLCQTIMP